MKHIVVGNHDSMTSGETVSPELALVDPALAERQRRLLPVRALDVLAPRIEVGASELKSPVIEPRALALDEPGAGALGRARAWRLPLGVAAVLVLALLLLDVHVEVGRSPASAESGDPALESRTPPAGGVGGPERLQERRFAWAPTAGASGYHVEIYQGAERIFVGTTRRPQITVPKTWRQGETSKALRAGEYRWYVWPVVSGRRSSRAVVQASLSIPAG
jgi:hypothetical protein